MVKETLEKSSDQTEKLLLLELIDYTTCQCDLLLLQQYNDKKFLQSLNKVLTGKASLEIKEWILQQVNTWRLMFPDDKDWYKNFSWYFKQVQDKGIPFPKFRNSKYLAKEDWMANASDWVEDLDWSKFMPNQLKLLGDMEMVREIVVLSNQLIFQKNQQVSKELLERIEKMESRIQILPDILQMEKETFLLKYSVALLYDIEQTKSRFK